jgi:hypothetical protein
VILPHTRSSFVAVLVFCQTLLILGVVALLEQHPLPPAAGAARRGVDAGATEARITPVATARPDSHAAPDAAHQAPA